VKNDVLKSLESRRSIRNYQPEQVSETDLQAVLRAGTYAPTGMNRQSPVLVAVTDKETRDLLSKLNAAGMDSADDPFYGAPAVVVVLADPSANTYLEDGALVLGNMLNAAYAVGLGSCWIHRAREVFASPEGKALLKKWGLPENLVGIGNCILGYPACDLPEPAPRKANYIVRI
jgi:nitroreductase